MAYQPSKESLSPTPTSDLLMSCPVTHAAESKIPSPVGTPQPKGSLQHRAKHLLRHWTSKPSVRMFIALTLVAIVSFAPALLSNSHDLKITRGGPLGEVAGLGVDGVALVGRVPRIDWSGTQPLLVSWYLLGSGAYREQNAWNPDRAVDIYITNISNPAFSYDPGQIPTPTDNNTIFDVPATFSTQHDISFGESAFSAPSDWYSFSIFVFAIEKDKNTSLPITYFALEDDGPGDFSIQTFGPYPSTNKFTYNGTGGPTTINVQSSTILPMVERSQRGRALMYAMFSVNWVLAACSIITTSVIFRQGGEIKEGVALLPITVILSIPTIRSFYPGTPPFGIYLDVVGFFPQILIVVICTVVVMCKYAMQATVGKGPADDEKAEV